MVPARLSAYPGGTERITRQINVQVRFKATVAQLRSCSNVPPIPSTARLARRIRTAQEERGQSTAMLTVFARNVQQVAYAAAKLSTEIVAAKISLSSARKIYMSARYTPLLAPLSGNSHGSSREKGVLTQPPQTAERAITNEIYYQSIPI